MTKLFAHHLFRWSLVAIALCGLGVGIYRFTPPEPMCEIDGTDRHVYVFADEGRRLITRSGPHAALGFLDDFHRADFQGPLDIWDTSTGKKLSSHFKCGETFPITAVSRDGRYVAVEIHKVSAVVEDRVERLDAIALLDTASGSVREIPLTQSDEDVLARLHFSTAGDLLVRMSSDVEKALRIFECSTGKLIDERVSVGFALNDETIRDVILHNVPGGVEVWSCRERKATAFLKRAGPNGIVSPDGRFLVCERWTEMGGQSDMWGVWDLRTNAFLAEFRSPDAMMEAISHDNRWLAICAFCKEGQCLELRELATGKAVASTPVHAVRHLRFSDDDQFLVVEGVQPTAIETVHEVPTLKTCWQMDLPTLAIIPPANPIPFGRKQSTVLFSTPNQYEMLCLDCATRRPIAVIPLLGHPQRSEPTLQMLADRRIMLVHQRADFNDVAPIWLRWLDWLAVGLATSRSNDSVIVFDARHCQERYRLIGWNVSSAQLAENGATLVTTHDEGNGRLIRCWDVNAWKPLDWAIGVPVGFAVLIGLFTWWRNCRRGPVIRTPESNAPSVA